jgi:predicted alpha/beta superfamily hydrolase
MIKFITTILCAIPLFLQAQYNVTLKVNVPAIDAQKEIYFASSINNWTPNASKFQLKNSSENSFEISIPNCPKYFEGKFTCGSWKTVEVDMTGGDAKNRIFNITKDTIFQIDVAAFKQELIQEKTNQVNTIEKLPSYRSKQVVIVNDAFYIPQLKTNRRIWMYVPRSYDSKKNFPVLYMHDGQNIFDKNTSFANEWGVDEYLDSAKMECIVIGIDNGGETRMQEYNPYDNEKYGKGKGKLYMDFIVQTLKPFIDRTYKTLKDKQNTFIAGSSMGGLISYYAGLSYPNTFGKIGVFSPSFWLCTNELKNTLKTLPANTKEDFYFYYGKKESDGLENEVKIISNATKQKCVACSINLSADGEGTHSEKYWQAALPKFFNWLSKK